MEILKARWTHASRFWSEHKCCIPKYEDSWFSEAEWGRQCPAWHSPFYFSPSFLWPVSSGSHPSAPIGLNRRAESSYSSQQPYTRFLAGFKLSGTATVIASVPFSSVTRVFPPLCLGCSFGLPYLILHWYTKDRMTDSKVKVCIKKGVKDWNQANAHWIFHCFNWNLVIWYKTIQTEIWSHSYTRISRILDLK